VLAAALSAAALHAHAASSVEQLRNFLTQTQRAQGEFTQRVAGKGPRTGSVQTSSGAFQFQRPGKFRWTYRAPYEQVIVGDGEKLFLYDKDLNQVTVKKLAAALPASPASILFGSNQFERDFEVSDGGVRDGLAWVLAKPRSRDTTFETIEIGFRDNLPAAMVLKDSFGQTTSLVFSKLARDVAPSADAFRFVPPQGADVLEEK
jgi:outer membrane lipoprotein carrier protein